MAKAVKKQRVARTRGGNTMTEAEFWSFIRSALRQKSRWWPPITQAKLKARRPSKSKDKRLKYEYQCAICKKWFPEKQTHIDHIIPAGSLLAYEDLPGFVERLFCESDGLRVLCKPCHHKVTQEQKRKS